MVLLGLGRGAGQTPGRRGRTGRGAGLMMSLGRGRGVLRRVGIMMCRILIGRGIIGRRRAWRG